MSRRLPSEIHSHWNLLVEGLKASPLDFYRCVEEAVERRQVPNAKRSRVEWHEGGLASAKREYLRVTRGGLNFDIGAAPFGTGFFFSYWLVGPTHALRYLLVLLVILLIIVAMTLKFFGMGLGFALCVVFVPAALLLLGDAIRKGRIGSEESVIAIPLIGKIYEKIFQPTTYYKVDTESMFWAAVHDSVMEVVDSLTTTQGIRPPSERERVPMLHRLAT
jgi:hypothetical protein